MKRNWKLLLCLLLALVALSACSSQPDPEDFPDITQAIGPTGTPSPTTRPVTHTIDLGGAAQGSTAGEAANPAGGESIFSTNPYDVLVDEGNAGKYGRKRRKPGSRT